MAGLSEESLYSVQLEAEPIVIRWRTVSYISTLFTRFAVALVLASENPKASLPLHINWRSRYDHGNDDHAVVMDERSPATVNPK